MSHAAKLAESIGNGSARLGVIGLGYVGLPVALTFAEAGYTVLGFDVDQAKIEALAEGRCYIRHLDAQRLHDMQAAQRFSASADFDRLADVDVVIICVPTPLTAHREPDLSYLERTADTLASRLRSGQLVILESTTYPGTTGELLCPRLEAGGLTCGEDFFLAFSPEREDPGNEKFTTRDIPKVVGGVDEISGDLAEAVYSRAFTRAVRVANARTAEATKLTENIFRAVNIALVNELKVVYDAMGIDVWDVLDAAATKPFGFVRFTPGPGWGGHCIPVDPFYLSWKAREHGVTPRFVELAGQVNVEMPRYVVDKLVRALNRRGKTVHGSRVLILGLAYKKDIDDPRESPAFEIIDQLLELGAEIQYHDPHVPVAPTMRTWPNLPAMESRELEPETLRAADAVLLITDHSGVDYQAVLEHAPLILDTRGMYREEHENVVKA